MLGPTSDHSEIRRWAERVNATPAEVKPFIFDSMPSIMRFLFGKEAHQGTRELRPISWDSFFARFDLLQLVLVYDSEEPIFVILQDCEGHHRVSPGER